MKLLKVKKENKSRLVIIGSLFIFLISSIYLGFNLLQSDEVKNLNEEQLTEFFEEYNETKSEEIIDEIREEVKQEKVEYEKYIGVLEIEKINFKRGFYNKESKNNKVNKNIEILKASDYPTKENGNVIIAGHNGNSSVSFFRNLKKLDIGDIAKIYFENKTYTYKLKSTYEVEKTGTVQIKRNLNKKTLTLITCKSNSNKQLVFIFELDKEE